MPTTLATCEVYGTIHDVFGQPVEGAVIGVMAVYKQGALVLSRTKEIATDVDGYFALELPRGPDCVAILYANTPGLNISALGTPTAIPDADSAELVSIIGDYVLWDQIPVAIPIGAGVASFNGRTGAIVLTSADVTGALGYTPADAAALASYLPLAGGTLTGPLYLPADPVGGMEAVTKQYADNLGVSGGAIGSYRLSTSTVPADPGTGKVGFNTNNQWDATELFVDVKTENGFDASNVWAQVVPGQPLTVQKRDNAALYARYTVVSVTNVMQFIRVAVTPTTHAGSWPLGNNQQLAVAATQAGGVTSFNTRTGAVVLVNTDVTAALGYTPVNRGGDAMLGTLTLAGAPAADLDAATKAYVDAHAGSGGSSTLPGQWLSTDFHASGSIKTFVGTIAAGALTTLTLTAASDFTVGQGILIQGAGNNAGIPNAYLAQVSAVDATKKIITLSAPATTAVAGAVVQHDDTVQLQAAINYIYAQGGGDLLLPPVYHRCNGPLNSYGSLLTFPYGSVTTTINITVGLIGTAPVNAPNFWVAPNEIYGAVIQTDVHNATGAILRCAAYAAQSVVSNITVRLENITFRTYPDPQISAVDLAMASNVFCKQIVVDTGASMLTGPEPTCVDSIGFRFPRDTVSSTGHEIGTIYVQNYYTGLVMTEQMVCIKAFAMKCKVGVRWDFAYHPAYAHIVIFWCPTSVQYASHSFTNAFYDIERDQPKLDWWNNPALLKDFDDPTDGAAGFTQYCIIQTNTGIPQTPVGVTGCSKMVFTNTTGLGTTIPLGLAPDPTQSFQIANKHYVDTQVATGGAGGGLSPGGVDGDLQLNDNGLFAPSILHQYSNGIDIAVQNETLGCKFDVMHKTAGWYFQIDSTGDYPVMGINRLSDGLASGRPLDISAGGSEIYFGGAYPYGGSTYDEGQNIWLTSAYYTDEIFIQGPNDPMGNGEGVRVTAQGANYRFGAAGLLLAADPTLPLHAATKQYVDAHAGGGSGAVDLAAAYAWTGAHSWTKPLVVNYAGGANAIKLQYPNGNITPVAYMDSNSWTNIGPSFDASAALGGSIVVYQCGTGPWSTSSYGACYVSGVYPGSWDFNANVQVRGTFEACNAGTPNTGFCVGTLGRVGFGTAPAPSVQRLSINGAVGWTALFISDMAAYSLGMAFSASGVFNIGTNAVIQLQGAHIEIYDGAAYKQIKFGAAGTGPGGTGRALYVD